MLVRLRATRERNPAKRQNIDARDEQRMQNPRLPLPTTAPKDIEWRLPRHARSVGRARALFREQAESWALPRELTDTAELLLSELMTNAYRHAKVPAGREIWARCVVTEDRVRMTVTDASDTLPTPGTASPDDESGRGLALVVALADDWGAGRRECGIGKEVWFELSHKPGDASPKTTLNTPEVNGGVHEGGVMAGEHVRWTPSGAETDDPERIAIREALAFGKALYDRRMALGLTAAELADRAGTTQDEIECIEEGGTAPTIGLLRTLAAALDSDVRLTPGHDLGSLWFEAHAA